MGVKQKSPAQAEDIGSPSVSEITSEENHEPTFTKSKI